MPTASTTPTTSTSSTWSTGCGSTPSTSARATSIWSRGATSAIVRFRIDGVLHQVYQIPAAVMAAMTSRIKILGRMDVVEKRRPQDGRIKTRTADGQEIELRLSTLPTAFGEKLVMRVFDPEVLVKDFTELGFSDEDKARWNQMTAAPHGIILVTGPTGSGKTTTLYSTLKTLATEEVNVCTIEDPIEMVEPAFNQMQVTHGIDLGFADGVRALMRQDPDIIMVGEIRDLETAEMAIQAALTGHLVLSTLHTNDSVAAITRLLDLGVPPYLLNSTILGVMAQRLVRTLCPHCKQKVPYDDSRADDLTWEEFVAPWKAKRPAHIFRPVGCLECRNTGYIGPHRHLRNPADVAGDEAPGRRQGRPRQDARAGLQGRHEAAAHQRGDENGGGAHHHRGSDQGRPAAAARRPVDCLPSRRMDRMVSYGFRMVLFAAAFGRLFQHSPQPIAFIRWNGGAYVEINQAWSDLLGYSRAEIIGKNARELDLIVDAGTDDQIMTLLRTEATLRDFEIKLRQKDGGVADVLYSGELVELRGEQVIVATLVDITERKQAERQLQGSERRFRDVLDVAGEYVWETDREGRYTFVSRRIKDVLGYDPEEVLGKTPTDFMPPAEGERVRKWMREERQAGAPLHNLEHQSIRKDGQLVWQWVSGTPVFDDHDRFTGYRGTALDVTEQRRVQADLKEAHRRLQMALEASQVSIWITDALTREVYLSEGWAELLGDEPKETLTTVDLLLEITHPDDRDRVAKGSLAAMRSDTAEYVEDFRVRTRSGDWRWIRSRGRVIERDAQGQALRMAGTNIDITDRKRDEQRIEELASRDPLTGLPNRLLLADRLSHALKSAQRDGTRLAVMFIDLDHFKSVNDTLGHSVGDLLLKDVAQRLEGSLRKGDTVSRLGGDEFIIVLERLKSAEDAREVAAKVISAIAAPYEGDANVPTISCSVGISLYPTDAQDAETLIHLADAAMYAAKERGRNNFQFSSPQVRPQSDQRAA